MHLIQSNADSQIICPRHQIHLIHLLDTPFAGRDPIGIAMSYLHQGKQATLLVRPSAFRQVIQTLPAGAQQVRVSLNTFQYEFHADNVVDLNGWTLRLRPVLAEGQSPQSRLQELLAEIQPRLARLNLPLTHLCMNATELDLIWLVLPMHRPGPEAIAQCRDAYASCLDALSEFRPLMENPLIATLPLDACCCAAQNGSVNPANASNSLLPELDTHPGAA